ncbi:hypothetical protein GCM10022293_51800 [Azospirillum formosense]
MWRSTMPRISSIIGTVLMTGTDLPTAAPPNIAAFMERRQSLRGSATTEPVGVAEPRESSPEVIAGPGMAGQWASSTAQPVGCVSRWRVAPPSTTSRIRLCP